MYSVRCFGDERCGATKPRSRCSNPPKLYSAVAALGSVFSDTCDVASEQLRSARSLARELSGLNQASRKSFPVRSTTARSGPKARQALHLICYQDISVIVFNPKMEMGGAVGMRAYAKVGQYYQVIAVGKLAGTR